MPPAVTLIVPRGWSFGSRQSTPSVRCQLIVAVSAYLCIREYIDNNMSSTSSEERTNRMIHIFHKRVWLEYSHLRAFKPPTTSHDLAFATNKMKKCNLSQLPVCPTQCTHHLKTCNMNQVSMYIIYSSLFLEEILAFYISIFLLAATRNFGGHRPPNLHGESSRNTKMLISRREKEMRTSYTYWPDSYYTSRGDARIGLFIRAIGKDFIFFILVVTKAEIPW